MNLPRPLSEISIDRRRFNTWLAAGVLAGIAPKFSRANEAQLLRVAALQMTPKLADSTSNMEQANQLILEAQRKGAEWIVLPEFFTSAAAFHPRMLNAIHDIDGAPAQMMKDLARRGDCVIGGSFLARRKGQVYNTFLLVFPDGQVMYHDKDQPTYWENCFYRGGQDEGVLSTPIGNVGSALCWELIRSRTMRRLDNRVRMLLGGSCWWTLSEDADSESPLRRDNLKMLQDAPVNCARMLGVPVVHGSHAGPFEGFFSPDLPDVSYNSSYLGETMIVDASGTILSRRRAEDGAGVAVANLSLPVHTTPSLSIPEAFWMPPEMPQAWKESWQRWLKSGAHYYDTVTKPFLDTGELNEYIPEYML